MRDPWYEWRVDECVDGIHFREGIRVNEISYVRTADGNDVMVMEMLVVMLMVVMLIMIFVVVVIRTLIL